MGNSHVGKTAAKAASSSLPAYFRDLKAEAKESVLRDQPVNQAIQDSDDDLPDVLAPEPEAWDKDF